MYYLKTKGVFKSDMFFVDIHNWEKTQIKTQHLKEAEKKYGIPNLWLYWTAIRGTPYGSYEQALRLMQSQIQFFESFISRAKPDFIVGDSIASMPTLFLDKIASYNNITFLQAFVSKIPGRFILKKSSNDNWFQVNKKFQEFKKRDLTEDEKKLANEFLSNFKNKQIIPSYMKFLKKRKFISKRSFKLFLTNLIDFYRYKGYEYYRLKSRFIPFRSLAIRFFHEMRQRFVNIWNPFDRPVAGEKYVLFPLHYQPEASTLINAPFYVDQINLVQSLAKSLPFGYKLYVKEHSNGYGRRPLSFFKKVKDYPNIRLIRPREPIHGLVKNASLVAVITSTTGWEALLYEKPVLTFGNVFFNVCDLVEKAPKVTELPEKLKQMITNYKFDKEMLQKFILAMVQESYEGIALLPNACGDKCLDKKNLKALARALNTELKLEKK